MSLQNFFNEIWYKNKWLTVRALLEPLSYLYGMGLTIRKFLPHATYQSRLPIIVVGNLSVGGSGKTPAILTLIALLQKQGFRVGVVSRGYPVNPARPILVNKASTPAEVGDEPLLIYQKTQVPVCVCRDRVSAIKILESQPMDVILSDDGLQNFTFKHTLEIVVVDSVRQFGNEKLLPAGPLREPISRLSTVDFVVEVNKGGAEVSLEHGLSLLASKIFQLTTDAPLDSLAYFQGKKVIALTAIANPDSFFENLTELGLSFERQAFHDHYAFSAQDFVPFKDAEILMTEKDAVKCASFANAHFWYLCLEGKFSDSFENRLTEKLKGVV